MAYLHIQNLYKNQDILMFKECYALEKIHGTSAHLSFIKEQVLVFGALVLNGKLQENNSEPKYNYMVNFFSGGVKHENFVALFDVDKLLEKFKALDVDKMTVYGEAYGGKCQGMSDVYGKDLKFVAFEVRIGDCWLTVPHAQNVVEKLDLEFVHYVKCSTDLETLDSLRDIDSYQAIINDMGLGKKREGIVLRPLIELRKNNGERIISKHKNEKFQETRTGRKIVNPDKLKVLAEANAVAEEWVVPNRLSNVLGKIQDLDITKMGEIIKAMIDDVKREGEKEIIWSKAVEKAIGRKTALMTKEYFKGKL